ncbi:MAG: hypothetical protein KC481_06740 [Acidimicrobiaceae bacterium]|jgi:hypothetical protein|nr:hypothetical protein [Acidimicrobiaceae bacterium]
MSWLVEGAATRDDLLALHPALAADHHRLMDEVWQASVDPRILELCRLRMATILGNQVAWSEPRSVAAVAAGVDESLVASLASWSTDPGFDAATRVCLGLAEQYVIDVHGITDTQVAEVEGHLGPDGVVTLTTALAAWEITHRFDNAFLDTTSTGAS